MQKKHPPENVFRRLLVSSFVLMLFAAWLTEGESLPAIANLNVFAAKGAAEIKRNPKELLLSTDVDVSKTAAKKSAPKKDKAQFRNNPFSTNRARLNDFGQNEAAISFVSTESSNPSWQNHYFSAPADARQEYVEGSEKIVSVAEHSKGGSRLAASRAESGLTQLTEEPTPLFITTSRLGDASLGQSYSLELKAQGGTPPYSWRIASGPLSLGLALDAGSGVLSGTPLEEMTTLLRVQVLDQSQKSDIAELRLNVLDNSLPSETEEIAEEQPQDLETTFSALEEDLEQEVVEAALEEEAEEDEITSDPGVSSGEDSIEDTEEASVLPIAWLIAQASDSKVGLAWKNPASADFSYVQIVRSDFSFPELPEEGVVVYRGAAENTVDATVVNSSLYYYSAFSFQSDGLYASLGESARATAMPLTVSISGKPDPFVDEVVAFSPLDPGNAFGQQSLPEAVLGPPSGSGANEGSLDVVSLQARVNNDSGASAPYGGSITLRFSDNIVVDGPGVDFTVFENAFRLEGSDTHWLEPAVVEVSIDGETFYRFPFDYVPHFHESGELNFNNPFSYAKGFAGVNPVFSSNLSPDPSDPQVSGGDSFDLSTLGAAGVSISWFQFIRITATGDSWLRDSEGDLVRHSNEFPSWAASGTGNSGFDLDAVSAVNY